MSEIGNIKNQVLRGGLFLTLRQLLSSGLSIVSVLVIARSLGPEKYGLVTSSLGIFYFLAWTGQMGLNMYIVRQPDLEEEEAEQLMAFYNTVGLLLCGLIFAATPLFAWWTGVPEVASILRWLVPAIWLNMVGGVSVGMLSSELKFDQVSLVEGTSQIANYLLSVPIVLLSGSYWGPVAGILLQFLASASLAYALRPIRLTFKWKWTFLKRMMTYGITFFFASWVQTLRTLTIPFFITPLAGVEAAGIAGVTLRMLEQLSLLRNVIRGMSISVMSKLMGSPSAVQRTINRGMSYMALLMITVCATFACISPWLIPLLFGAEWLQSTRIFPPIAFTASVIAVFDLHLATLHAVGRNNIVTLQNLTYIGLLWLSCWLLIPSFGLWGYVFAEMVALPSFYISHRAFSALYGYPNYWNAILILVTAVPSLIVSVLLPPPVSFVILLLCYGLLFVFNADMRELVKELLLTFNSKKLARS
ncbi:hypothetical protein C7271_00665 [filamentous cyanobacterium CCP5]|nr:hypothetical protein C7271_00665 [filamentous cyanobacterium CCP5]